MGTHRNVYVHEQARRKKQKMGAGRWEHFPHEADIGIRGIGSTREEAFEQAALALTAVTADPSSTV